MLLVEEYMRQKELHSLIVNSVHDSIVIDTYPGEEEQVKHSISEAEQTLRTALLQRLEVDIDVELPMDCKIGPNWMSVVEYA